MKSPHGALSVAFQKLLKSHPQTLNDLRHSAKLCGMPQSHANVVVNRMCQAGLVTCEKQGKEMLVTWIGGDV